MAKNSNGDKDKDKDKVIASWDTSGMKGNDGGTGDDKNGKGGTNNDVPSGGNQNGATVFDVPFDDEPDEDFDDPVREVFEDQGNKYTALTGLGSCGNRVKGSSLMKVSFYVEVVFDTRRYADPDALGGYLSSTAGPSMVCPSLPSARRVLMGEDSGREMQRRSLQGSPLNPVIGLVQCAGGSNQFVPFNVGAGGPPTCRQNHSPAQGHGCVKMQGSICIYCELGAGYDDCRDAGLALVQENSRSMVKANQGIFGVSFLGGMMAGDTNFGQGPGSFDAWEASFATQQMTNGDGGAGDALSPAGWGLVAAGAGSLLVVAVLLIARKTGGKSVDLNRYGPDDSYLYRNEGKDHMDKMPFASGDSLDGTAILSDLDRTLTPSPRKRRSSNNMGWGSKRGASDDNDDSLNGQYGCTRACVNAGSDYFEKARSALNVHQCNSAMCQVCLVQGTQPRFISASSPNSSPPRHLHFDTSLSSNSHMRDASRHYDLNDTVDF